MKLVTGTKGEVHVGASDIGLFNASTVGAGKYVFNKLNKFAYELVSNNLIKIKSGVGLDQGRYFSIPHGEIDDVAIENGLVGTKRVDLIVARYSYDPITEKEKTELVVVKGTSGNNYVVPDHVSGNILTGSITDDFVLYEVKINGLSIESVTQKFVVKDAYIDYVDKITEDSGWINIIGSNITNTTLTNPSVGGQLSYRKKNGRVEIKGQFGVNADSKQVLLFTLPVGFRNDSFGGYYYCKGTGTGTIEPRFLISNDGKVYLDIARNITDGSVVTGPVSWLGIDTGYEV